MEGIIALVASSILFAGQLQTVNSETLDKNGLNVCSKKFSYNVYTAVKTSYVSYDNYRTCCKKIIFCVSRCTKYRTRIRYYYKSVLSVKYSTSYYCCPGWARQGSQCTRAICHPPCQTGDCITPNVCKCKKGFVGKYCETDVNECNVTPRPCQQTCTDLRGSYACSCLRGYIKNGTSPQDRNCLNVNECEKSQRLCRCAVSSPLCKATCVDTIGSYRCQCNAGFKLIANKICTDFDECRTGNHNCEQLCVNDRGGFKCACRVGYWLRNDKRSCYDLNECRRANGGCEQQCTNLLGSYKCGCRDGFKLMYDKTRCQDVDECISKRPCDKYHGKCFNTFGSYKCGCDRGYELNSDAHSCSDLNECKRINDCEHNCHNSDGSYFCSCKAGYRLASDKRKCIDVDECKEGLHDCHQLCRNVHGSFTCHCKAGFVRHTDKKTCKPVPCKSLYVPNNGKMQCTGNNVGDTCTFSCNYGYELDGNAVKTCKDNSRWDDDHARCKPKKCPRAHPPVNGALMLPCIDEYTSQCIVKCKRGFLLRGSPIISCGMENGKANWTTYNATCEEISLCKPNPCFHGGKCRIISQKEYECNCKDTGYDGKNCQYGVFVLPKYPQLVSGVTSDILIVEARPKEEIILTPEAVNGIAVFTPASISFTSPQVKAQFTVRATGKGLIRIKYVVSGQDRVLFAQPPDSFLYVLDIDPSDRIQSVPDSNFMVGQCNELLVDRCQNGENVKLLSTCRFDPNGTLGYQSVKAKNIQLPLSLAGLVLPKVRPSKWLYRSQGVVTVAKETALMMKKGLRSCPQSSRCEDVPIEAAEHKHVVQANLFLKSYLQTRNKVSPWWSVVKLVDKYMGFHINNIQSLLVKGSRLKDLTDCNFAPFTTGIYSVIVNHAPLQIQLFNQVTTIRNPKPICIAVDVCGGMSYLSLPKDAPVDLTPKLRTIGITTMDLKLGGLGTHLNTSSTEETCFPKRNVFDLKDEMFCIKRSLWAPIHAQYRLPSSTFSLRGQIYVEPTSVSEVVLQMFNSELKTVYKGEIKAKFQFMAGGETFVIDVLDTTNSTSAVSSFGETSANKCDRCSQRGKQIRVPRNKIDFLPLSSVVTFHPTKDSKVVFDVHHNMVGGRVHKIDHITRFQLSMRLIAQSVPVTIQSVILSVRVVAMKYRAEIDSLNSLKAVISTKLFAAQKLALAPSPDLRQLYIALEELKALVVSLDDTLRLLSARISKFETSQSLVAMYRGRVRFLSLRLQQLVRLEITPAHEKVTEHTSGLSMSYDGILCFHALCFGQVKAGVHDLSDDCNSCHFGTTPSQDRLMVAGIFKEGRVFRGTISVGKDAKLHGWVHKQKDEFSANFPAKVIAFGTQYTVDVSVNNNLLSIPITNAKVTDDFTPKLDIFVTNSKRVRWSTMAFEARGKADNTVALATKLKDFANKYVSLTQKQTRDRLDMARKRVTKATAELIAGENILEDKRRSAKNSQDAFKMSEISYKMALTNYNRTLIQFRSYRVGDFFRNLEKTLDNTCVIRTCKDVCYSVPTCDVCQSPVFVDVDVIECKQVSKKVDTTVEEPVNSQCAMTSYQFTPIYTGTCKKGRQKSLTGALVTTGTGTGALVGMAIAGPVGAAVGSVVGAAVGFFASMFSSCDESYEVYKQVFNYKVPCTLKTFNVRTKRWVESVCYPVKKRVLSTYDVPEECNCNNGTNSTCVKIINPNCIKDNQECRRRREVVVRRNMESAGQYNESYFSLNAADKKLQETFTKMKTQEQSHIEANKNLEMQIAIEKKHRLNSKLANQSLENAISGLQLEKCLMGLGDKLKNQDVFKVQKIEFQSRTLNAVDLLLKVDLVSHDGSVFQGYYFVYDLDDQDQSARLGAEKFVRNMFCRKHTRSRRSINAHAPHTASLDHDHVSGFSHALGSSPKNITESNAACIVYTRVMDAIDSSFSKLRYSLTASEEKKKNLRKELDALRRAEQENKKDDGESLVQVQADLLKKMENRADVLLKAERNDLIFNSWLKDMEIFWSANNFSSCMSFHDCMEQGITDLRNLPTMYRKGTQTYLDSLKDLENHIQNVLRSSAALTLLLVTKVSDKINQIKSSALFCADPPQVRLLEQEKIEARVGTVVYLNCDAKSDLTIRYQWLHNDSVLPGETNKRLRIEVDNDMAGRYKCEAITKAGRNESEDTFLVVGLTPSVTIDPQNFTYHYSMDKLIVPTFECNVTADPPARINWYKESFDNVGKIKKLYINTLAIRFDGPRASDAGWYFCEATNNLGTVRSKKARLDIVTSNFPNQALEMKFDMDLQSDAVPEKTYYEKKVRIDAELKASQLVNVSLQFQSEKKLNLGIKITDNIREEQNAPSRRRRSSQSTSELEILRRVSNTRKSLASSLQKVVAGFSGRQRRSVGSSISNLIEQSLELSFDGDLCPDGSQLHNNGFTCVECTPGHFENNRMCKRCPIGTYQPNPGHDTCLECADTLVTAATGMSSKSECIVPELKSVDILFALDASASVGTSNWKKVIAFVTSFSDKYFDPTKNIRVGVIVYSRTTSLEIPLQNYQLADLKRRISRLSYQGSTTRTYDALNLARKLLVYKRKPGHNQFVIVMTDGKSSTLGGTDGSIITRKRAIELRQAGVHTFAIGVGGNEDVHELLSIASFPKKKNILRVGDFSSLAGAAPKVVASALRGVCSIPTIDIAVVVESSERVDQKRLKNTIVYLTELLSGLRSLDHNVALFTLGSNVKVLRSYAPLGSEQEIKDKLSQLKTSTEKLDITGGLEQVYNQYLTEKHSSLSHQKVVVLITKDEVEDTVMQNLYLSYPDEDVTTLNVVMTLENVEEDIEYVGVGLSRSVFSLSQLQQLRGALRFDKGFQC